jgi:opacity protein-like surface antigen
VALADEYASKKVTYERPTDWSGVYFGVGSGYQWSSIDVRHVPSAVNPGAGSASPGIGFSSDHDEWFASAHIGVQHQFAHPWGLIVLGIEGGWMSTIRDREGDHNLCNNGLTAGTIGTPGVLPGGVAALATPLTGAAGNFCTSTLNDIVTIGLRAGWAAGHWMPYITGGYASAGFDFENRVPCTSATTLGCGGVVGFGATALHEEAHDRLNGWYIGGGFEWVISPGWTTGIEYRHYEFDARDTTAFSRDLSVPSVALERLRFEATTDTVEARVSWRWGRPEAAAPLK